MHVVLATHDAQTLWAFGENAMVQARDVFEAIQVL